MVHSIDHKILRNRIVESHEQLTARMEATLAENQALREASKELISTAQKATDDCAALEQHNTDLSAQLQHLLRKSMGHVTNRYV